MSFIWPSMLIFLVLVPLFVLLYTRIQRRRQRLAASYGSLGVAQQAANRQAGSRRHLPPLFFLAGLTLLLLALARPQMVLSLPRIEGTVILAFDVSGSMAADDLQPTRMEAAKTAAQDFVLNQPTSVLIGVVAFSDSGFTVQKPTNDQAEILATINRLAPERGTSLANGIYTSLSTIATETEPPPNLYSNLTPQPTPSPTPVPQGFYSPSAIVLLTDGENNVNPDPLEAAQAAADRGVRIYTVGIGSPEGATLEIEGFSVHTQLNEPLLQQISALTGGTYYNAQTEQDLQSSYENLDPQLVIKPEKMEVTATFAGASLLIFLIGGTFSLLWFRRLP
jgi:Ca-activated chloride channel family protein